MQLLNQIQNIANQVQIKSTDFFVSHPNYRSLQLSNDLILQLQKLPQNIQLDYLRTLLTKLIFGIYRNDLITLKKSEASQSDYEILLKNTASEVDWEFCEKLINNNQGKGWWNSNFIVLRQEDDGSLVVQKKGISVHIQRERHLQLQEQSAVVGDRVSVFTPSGQVIDQFYAAFGDSTTPFRDLVVFIYFNFSPEGAVAVMKSLTAQLNVNKVSFIFNVLHNPSNYRRYDSGFLRFDKGNYELVRQVLQSVYVENESHFQNQVPLFTKVLAPGIALAEKPAEYEFKFLDDFGMNRCQIIANALLEAHQNNNDLPKARVKYIFKHFEQRGIDPERPYLNPNSEDIYAPLDLANGVRANSSVAK